MDTALVDLASALTASCTRVDAVGQVAARAAASLVGDFAGVRLAGDDGRERWLSAYHLDPAKHRILGGMVGGPSDEPGEGPSAGLRATGHPAVLPTLGPAEFHQFAPHRYWPQFERAGACAGLVCPLIADETVLGCLTLARTEPARTYTESDVALAADIAAQVAPALATALATERLRASEQRYRTIVETTLDGVWQFDGDGVTVFANERMAELVGLRREAMVGLSLRGFLDNAGQAQLDRRLSERRQGLSEVYECRLIRANGSGLWVQVSAAPMTDDDGEFTGSLCMVTDITDRVAARDMRRQLDQLRRTDSLGQLAGGIAHDFNNLLTVIGGSAEILVAESEPGASVHELAGQIVQASKRGGALVHQLLAFGRRSPNEHAMSMAALLDGARDLLSRALGEHIRLEVKVEPGLWPVVADPGQIEQALANLATNARDAMGRGGVLTIEAANCVVDRGQLDAPDVTGRFVRLSVSDTGTGMDPETRQRAFEPFFTTRQARGSAGLGLATVDGVVRRAGGHIRMYSEPGIGTTINVFLPAVHEPAHVEPAVVEAAPHSGGAPRRGRILVVEDQPELAELIRYLLEPAGFTVTVTTDPAAAIAHIHTGAHPDLLLTDVVMPGMTGSELAKALRVRRPGLRVLYMSGYTAGVLNPQGHLDANSALLQKPFNRESLLAAVDRALAATTRG